ncbi:hypothetical protein [Bacillus sp. FJAT-28004]|nr:hypothetical protein [Bacillus sp. FJAT-28004]
MIVYVSMDGTNFTKVSDGTWANDNTEKKSEFPARLRELDRK